jgi:hypothetical protein
VLSEVEASEVGSQKPVLSEVEASEVGEKDFRDFNPKGSQENDVFMLST